MILDLVCLALLVLGAAAGAMSGAVRQLFQLAVVAGAVLGSRLLSGPAAAAFGGSLPKTATLPIAAAVIFVALVIALGLLAKLVVGAAEAFGALRGPLDRALGALLSGAKAALVVWLALSALTLWGGALRLERVGLDAATSDFAAFSRDANLIHTVQGKPARGTAPQHHQPDDPQQRTR